MIVGCQQDSLHVYREITVMDAIHPDLGIITG
jgi:hypothetical protein